MNELIVNMSKSREKNWCVFLQFMFAPPVSTVIRSIEYKKDCLARFSLRGEEPKTSCFLHNWFAVTTLQPPPPPTSSSSLLSTTGSGKKSHPIYYLAAFYSEIFGNIWTCLYIFQRLIAMKVLFHFWLVWLKHYLPKKLNDSLLDSILCVKYSSRFECLSLIPKIFSWKVFVWIYCSNTRYKWWNDRRRFVQNLLMMLCYPRN